MIKIESKLLLTVSLIGILLIGVFIGIFLGVGYIRYIRKIIRTKRENNTGIQRDPKIVVIGGGTGLSVLLRGLKKYTSNITAIVTVADDGGGSGVLREDLGMLPPGDIRNCILALADTEPTMEKLLQYRFEEGMLKGQSFGNLLIAAMNGISDNFEEAIKKINKVMAVTGQVLPVTIENITLFAKLKNNNVIKGESNIPVKAMEMNSKIDEVFMKPSNAKGTIEGLEAIDEADIIVLGPGSLYTSIIPNLLVKDIIKALRRASGEIVYITNVMTQPGETDDYNVVDHVMQIKKYLRGVNLDCVFVNDECIPINVLDKYTSDGATPLILDKKQRNILEEEGIKIIEGNFLNIKKNYIRHDANEISKKLINISDK